jgi:hypothetical protein
LGGRVAQEVLQRFRARAVPGKCEDLDLVHREDRAGRGACRPEGRACFRYLRDACPEAAQRGRDPRAEETLGPQRIERFAREPRISIYVVSCGARNIQRNLPCLRDEHSNVPVGV